jgi:hypothetical protein
MNPTEAARVETRMEHNSLKDFIAEHKYLLELAALEFGFDDPRAIDLGCFFDPLLKASRKGPVRPVDGVLVRHWDPNKHRVYPGIQLGMRGYTIDGVTFAHVCCPFDNSCNVWAFNFTVVDRKDYYRLFKIALRCRRDLQAPSNPPILPAEQLDLLWKNTIGYLEGPNLRRIQTYGGRAKRGVLLTGAPGNGKTMACRWIWDACRQRGWEWRLVTPDAYRMARANDSIDQLFNVESRGIIFFDDMDLALRDRETVHESEDQAVFLSAMDGITLNEGVVFVFTTNCALDLIDRAFKRPGRIDLVLHFKAPEADLRRRLMERWHEDIRRSLDVEEAVGSTEGYSFAEIEELKNLLVMNYLDTGTWDWAWALKQFDINRNELSSRPKRHVGFGLGTLGNGKHADEVPY